MGAKQILLTGTPAQGDPTTIVTSGFTINDTRSLAEAKLEAALRAQSQYDALVAAGRTIASVNRTFPIDRDTLTNLFQNFNSADTTIVDINGNVLTPSQAVFQAGVTNLVTYARKLANVLAAHRVSIKALADVASCDAYDVTANWPSNP